MAIDAAAEPQLPEPINGTEQHLAAILGVLRSIDAKLPARTEKAQPDDTVELREPAAARKGRGRG